MCGCAGTCVCVCVDVWGGVNVLPLRTVAVHAAISGLPAGLAVHGWSSSGKLHRHPRLHAPLDGAAACLADLLPRRRLCGKHREKLLIQERLYTETRISYQASGHIWPTPNQTKPVSTQQKPNRGLGINGSNRVFLMTLLQKCIWKSLITWDWAYLQADQPMQNDFPWWPHQHLNKYQKCNY